MYLEESSENRVLAAASYSTSDYDTHHDEEFFLVEVVFVCTVFAIVLIEQIIHVLEKKAKKRKHFLEMLRNFYKELMILGIAALGVTIFNQLEVAGSLGESYKHIFEDVHYTLFLIAACHGFFVAALVLQSERVSRQWERAEELGFRHWRDLRAEYEALVEGLGLQGRLATRSLPDRGRRLRAALRHPRRWQRLAQLTEYVRFHDLRHHFIRANHLPANFHFVTYLKKCKQHVTLHFTEIHRGVWLGIAWVISVDLFMRAIFTKYREGFVGALALVAACASTALFLVAIRKTGQAYWRLLHSELVHWDPARPAAFTFRNLQGDQKSLFWFGRPNLILSVVQLNIFLISTCVAILVQNTDDIIASNLLVPTVVMTLVAAATAVLMLPTMIPRYTVVTHTGQFVDLERLADALTKQQRRFHQRTMAAARAALDGPGGGRATLTLTLSELRTEFPGGGGGLRLRARGLELVKNRGFQHFIDVLLLVDFFVLSFGLIEHKLHGLNRTLVVIQLALGLVFFVEIIVNIYCRGVAYYLRFDALPRLLTVIAAVYSFVATIAVVALPPTDARFWLHVSTVSVTFRFLRSFKPSNFHKHQQMAIDETEEEWYASRPPPEEERMLKQGQLDQGVEMLLGSTPQRRIEEEKEQSDIVFPGAPGPESVDPEHYISEYNLTQSEKAKEAFSHQNESTKSVTLVERQYSDRKISEISEASTHGGSRSARAPSRGGGGGAPPPPPCSRAALAQELWEEACAAHPEVAAAHGRLSVPVLRLMLGMPAFRSTPMASMSMTALGAAQASPPRAQSMQVLPGGGEGAAAAAAAAAGGGPGGGGGEEGAAAATGGGGAVLLKRVDSSPAVLRSPAALNGQESGKGSFFSSLLTTINAEENYYKKVLKFSKILRKGAADEAPVQQVLALTRDQLAFFPAPRPEEGEEEEGSGASAAAAAAGGGGDEGPAAAAAVDAAGLLREDRRVDRVGLHTLVGLSPQRGRDGRAWLVAATPDRALWISHHSLDEAKTQEWLEEIEAATNEALLA